MNLDGTPDGRKAPMDRPGRTGQEYWRDVLLAGGFTAIPRWTSGPAPGVGQHDEPLPDDVLAASTQLATDLGVTVTSVFLAVHAVVLAALTGEREVTSGYLVPGTATGLPCRLGTSDESWREVLRRAHRTEADLLAHADVDVATLRSSLGAARQYETMFAPGAEPRDADADAELPEGVVLEVGVPVVPTVLTVLTVPTTPTAAAGPPVLRLRYRRQALDPSAAARLAGYHLTALRLLVADAGAAHRRQNLLSDGERHHQLTALAGPAHPLPDRRVHELFEDRVRRHPDAVAAVQGDRRWTYAELNARANRLGRALLARGLRREQVVAVVTERNLDWMAAVLAILKAGGVYLPLEPHFPASRIGKALSRSGCTLVLTEPGSTTTLDEALAGLPDVRPLVVDDGYAEGHADDDLGVEVGPDQLAYLLFTSGSTGEPKGAMCEHAGMLNHMYAKIVDLGIGEGEVIPATGPQCFDISVWQLLAALLVGGRTLVVEQDVVLDVERLVDTIVAERAGVLQVVPSYLDAVLTYLEQHPRKLPDLHTVCPTGDFLKKELVQRWFAAQPDILMVNTYGLTETSDDAVHEIMDRVPDAPRVPLGRPIINTPVYVTDEYLQPVPLGAPGLIVFGGVCVGRGYVNDAERTAAMFRPDPHRPGGRVCVTGDYGRWMPDGTLDFLGRRDTQVKIRGFRIEIGEIENALLRVPGVRDGAVVVAQSPDGGEAGKRLVGFSTGADPLDGEAIRKSLARYVPEYMVPSVVHWRETLPLTANGKIDRTTLTALAGELTSADGPAHDHEVPRTPTELRLAAAWSDVLGIDENRIGRRDHFFDLGGTSMSAVKLAIALKRAASLKEITRRLPE